MSTIVGQFMRLHDAWPDRPLVHLPASGVTLTAAAIRDAYSTHQDVLAAAGIGPGQLIVSTADNRPSSVALLLACRARGAVLMPVDASTTDREALDLAARFGAAALVVPSPVAALDAQSLRLDDECSLVPRAQTVPAMYPGAALLKLTSGSTGRPKAVLAAERHLVADGARIAGTMGIGPADTQIAAIPLSHSYGLGNLMMPLLLQGSAIVLRESFVPHQLPADAQRFGARVFPGVPFMFEYFIAHPPPDGWPPCLRLLISAGARLDPSVARDFQDLFGVKIHSFYGASETGGIAYDATETLDVGSGVGRPLPGVTITLRAEAGAPPGSGRVHIRSTAVGDGYANEATRSEGFIDDGFLTGDYGRFDELGRLMLTGRASMFVNVAGRKVRPEEVECVLRSMPDVKDARVVGAPDARRGEQIVALVVPSGALTIVEVRRYCAGRLAPHKIPRSIVFVEAIPVTARGKTDDRSIEALVRAHLAGRAKTM